MRELAMHCNLAHRQKLSASPTFAIGSSAAIIVVRPEPDCTTETLTDWSEAHPKHSGPQTPRPTRAPRRRLRLYRLRPELQERKWRRRSNGRMIHHNKIESCGQCLE
jgi:hypothetical protein